jgi:transposase
VDKAIRIGLDTSKKVFQVHGVDAAGHCVMKEKLQRRQLLSFFGKLEPSLVGLETCGASHHWARELRALGHDVRLVPPRYVKMFLARQNKNDARDAEAICEALARPSVPFVPIKTEEQQADLMLLSVRSLLNKQRTMLINAIRGHAAEFGIVGALGTANLAKLLETMRSSDIPTIARDLIEVLAGQVDRLDAELSQIDRRLRDWFRTSPVAQRLATIPGVGVIAASLLAMKVPDPRAFQSGRHLAAWLGLTPRQNSTAGKNRLGKITREGDEALRNVLVVGATSIVRWAKPGRTSPWLLDLLQRKPRKLAAVALANKNARIAWAIMMRGEIYCRPTPA